jgi:transcriptional regulator with XRE-family HTH domain
MELNNKQIGENIRIFRTLRGYSQHGLAAKIGKTQNWLHKIEKGELAITIDYINEIAKELDVDAQQLVFAIPQQIFNNCTQSGNYNQYIINSEELYKLLIDVLKNIERKL